MKTVREAKEDIQKQLKLIVDEVNLALNGGKHLEDLKSSLERLGRGGKLPHWYERLRGDGTLPNLDGKSLGSVLEMVFVGILEQKFLRDTSLIPLRINPARGVDIPSLELGIKCPSENYCTSEPFFSAYERLLGNEHDAVILLTDYQTQKKSPPLRIQIINHSYLKASQIADKKLCGIANRFRDRLLRDHVSELKKVIRFLAYVNQSDWEAKAILRLLDGGPEDQSVDNGISMLVEAFTTANKKKEKDDQTPFPADSLARITAIHDVSPRWLALVNAADNWVIETQKDFGRYPNESEWNRFLVSPLDGVIGMSYALQWRYNFGPLFTKKKT